MQVCLSNNLFSRGESVRFVNETKLKIMAHMIDPIQYPMPNVAALVVHHLYHNARFGVFLAGGHYATAMGVAAASVA